MLHPGLQSVGMTRIGRRYYDYDIIYAITIEGGEMTPNPIKPKPTITLTQ